MIFLAPTRYSHCQHLVSNVPLAWSDNCNNNMPKAYFYFVSVLFRRCHRLSVRPQQEADDLLFERTSAATRETGVLINHVRTSYLFPFFVPFFIA